MKFEQPITAGALAEEIGATLYGDPGFMITGINEIHKVESGDVTFVDISKYFEKSFNSNASVIILPEYVESKQKIQLVCSNPFEAYNSIVLRRRPIDPQRYPTHHSAVIDQSAIIEPGVVIGKNVRIGKHSYIMANAVIGDHTEIGDNVIIQQGALIGTDAFYYKKTPDGYLKWRTGGRVIIHDDVEIGAGCTIARGVSGDTIIGKGSKLDCQVHIGHGAVLGSHCLLAAQVGIGGKTIVGNNVVMYGQVGIAQNLHIGDGVTVLAQSGVSKDLEANKTYFGYPAEEARDKYRELATLRQMIKANK